MEMADCRWQIGRGVERIQKSQKEAFMDLTKGPPRSAKSAAILGCVAVARMADKGRAQLAGKIGEYKYGNDSGMDKATLDFLGMTADAFLEALRSSPDDTALEARLRPGFKRTPQEVEQYNQSRLGPPTTPERVAMFQDRLAKMAPGRTDLKTLWDLTDLDDRKSFGLD